MGERELLRLVWKNPVSRKNYTVGELERRNSVFFFRYCEQYKEALNEGWEMIQAFPDDKEYKNESLFPVFASRLPDKKRKNIDEILQKYCLKEYDGFALLRQSGGRLPIDTYEFIDPIFEEDVTVEREFWIAGTRHVAGCRGKKCTNCPELSRGEELNLVVDQNNEYDKYAVKILTLDGHSVGFVPRYYSKGVAERLASNMTYHCFVKDVDAEHNCQECIKVKLQMPK